MKVSSVKEESFFWVLFGSFIKQMIGVMKDKAIIAQLLIKSLNSDPSIVNNNCKDNIAKLPSPKTNAHNTIPKRKT